MQCNKSEIIDTEMETQILSILLELNGKMSFKKCRNERFFYSYFFGVTPFAGGPSGATVSIEGILDKSSSSLCESTS